MILCWQPLQTVWTQILNVGPNLDPSCLTGPQVRVLAEKYFPYFSTKTYVVDTLWWDGSFEHPKHMHKQIGKKIIAILHYFFCCLTGPMVWLRFFFKKLARRQQRHENLPSMLRVKCRKTAFLTQLCLMEFPTIINEDKSIWNIRVAWVVSLKVHPVSKQWRTW